MLAERAMMSLHAGAVLLALTAALVWPRAGQAAVLVPVGSAGLDTALGWAARENAPLLAIDTASGRVVVRLSERGSAASAIASGIIPLASRARGCATAVGE